MGGLGEPQPAVLDERDAAYRQLHFQHVAVPGGAHQHGLVAQVDAGFVGGQHPGADLPGLGRLVVAADQLGRGPGTALRVQVQLQAG